MTTAGSHVANTVLQDLPSRGTKAFPVRIKPTGFPDFSDYMINRFKNTAGTFEDLGKSRCGLTFFKLTGYRQGTSPNDKNSDNVKANQACRHRFPRMHLRGPGPNYAGKNNGGYRLKWSWHHHEVPGIMQLVFENVHRKVGHVGGAEMWSLATGYNYDDSQTPRKRYRI